MPTSTDITKLVINQLTEAQYDAAVQAGTIGATDICFLTDAEAGQIIQVSTMPTAASTEEGNIYQFVGTTGTYTNGYFYKCISDGGNPATYSWQQINVQPQGSSSLSTLSDVSITSVTSGQVLSYNGSDWENTTKYAAQIVDYTA